jgi:copper chaperone NosL
MKLLASTAVAVAALTAGVVFLWPSGSSGPQPIVYGRDACASCRMHMSRPGFAGEIRARDGALTKYDDIGCLVRAILAGHREVPAAWVEDHATGTFVPLLSAHLVRAESAATPMGSGLVAFADADAARDHARAHGGRVMAFEDVLHDGALLARLTARPGRDTEDTP